MSYEVLGILGAEKRGLIINLISDLLTKTGTYRMARWQDLLQFLELNEEK